MLFYAHTICSVISDPGLIEHSVYLLLKGEKKEPQMCCRARQFHSAKRNKHSNGAENNQDLAVHNGSL